MDLQKVRGTDTREALKYLHKTLKQNHLETKELINDTNLNFIENEKKLNNEIKILHDKINNLENIIKKLISQQIKNNLS